MVRALWILVGCLSWASCVSTRALLREERADRETIEKAFAAADGEVRCLAARSCLWAPEPGCAERLAEMAVKDADSSVRSCALEVLGEGCTQHGRALLVGLREKIDETEGRAFLEAARLCPSADLTVALGTDGLHGKRELLGDRLRPGWRGRFEWISRALGQPPPNGQALAALGRASKKLDQESAGMASRESGQELQRRATAALGEGKLDEAEALAWAALERGAIATEILLEVETRRLEAAIRRLEQAKKERSLDLVLQALGPDKEALRLLFPEVAGLVHILRYQRDLALAKELVALAREGKHVEATKRLEGLPPSTSILPFEDLAKVQEAQAMRLIEAGEHDRAWREAWLVRAGKLLAADAKDLPRHAGSCAAVRTDPGADPWDELVRDILSLGGERVDVVHGACSGAGWLGRSLGPIPSGGPFRTLLGLLPDHDLQEKGLRFLGAMAETERAKRAEQARCVEAVQWWREARAHPGTEIARDEAMYRNEVLRCPRGPPRAAARLRGAHLLAGRRLPRQAASRVDRRATRLVSFALR